MKLSEDPISIGLVIASVVLLGLYFYEDAKLSTLDQAESRAQAIDLGALDDETCEAHAAGFEGRNLTIRCQNSAEALEIASAVADAAHQARFETVRVFGKSPGSIQCELPLEDMAACKPN